MNAIAEQCRKAYLAAIRVNPTQVRIQRRAVISDGFGGFVPDYGDASPTEIVETVRISHEQASVPAGGSAPVGIATTFGLYAMLPWNSQAKQGEEIVAGARRWRLGVIDSHIIMGEVYGKRAPVIETSSPGIEPPSGFLAVASGPTSVTLSWADFVGNGYSIERKTGAEDFEVVASIGAGTFSHIDTGLTAATTYVYRLRASDGTKWSAYTPERTVTTDAE